MLFDTSNARITVPSRRGTPTLAWGRASATSSSASAARKSANGTWRSRRRRPAAARGHEALRRQRGQRAGRGGAAAAGSRRASGHEHQEARAARGQANDISGLRARRSADDGARGPSTRSSSVDTACSSTPARAAAASQLGLARVGGRLGEAAAELGVARCRPRAARRSRRPRPRCRPGVGQLVLARVEQADARRRSWRWASSASGRSQPGLADEVGDDHDQRAAADRCGRAGSEQAGEVGGGRRRRGAGGPQQVAGEAQHLVAAGARRDASARARLS